MYSFRMRNHAWYFKTRIYPLCNTETRRLRVKSLEEKINKQYVLVSDAMRKSMLEDETFKFSTNSTDNDHFDAFAVQVDIFKLQ